MTTAPAADGRRGGQPRKGLSPPTTVPVGRDPAGEPAKLLGKLSTEELRDYLAARQAAEAARRQREVEDQAEATARVAKLAAEAGVGTMPALGAYRRGYGAHPLPRPDPDAPRPGDPVSLDELAGMADLAGRCLLGSSWRPSRMAAALLELARRSGLDEAQAVRTIADGLRAGRLETQEAARER